MFCYTTACRALFELLLKSELARPMYSNYNLLANAAPVGSFFGFLSWNFLHSYLSFLRLCLSSFRYSDTSAFPSVSLRKFRLSEQESITSALRYKKIVLIPFYQKPSPAGVKLNAFVNTCDLSHKERGIIYISIILFM